jgi:hypothetical protein
VVELLVDFDLEYDKLDHSTESTAVK